MKFEMIRYKVRDFKKWKQLFEADKKKLENAGYKKYGLYKTLEDPNELILFFEIDNVEKAKAFTYSDEMKKTSEEATVFDSQEPVFVELIDKKEITEKKAA